MELYPIFYAGASIISFFARATVFIAGMFGNTVDPLPDHQGPQFPRTSNLVANETWESVQQLSVDEVKAKVKAATVFISLTKSDGNRYEGSGICIHPEGYILSVEHVIVRGKCDIAFEGREPVQGSIVHSQQDGYDGACLISCQGENYPYINVAPSIPTAGTPIVAAGHHAGNYVSLKGELAGEDNTLGGNVDYMQRPFYRFSFSAMAGMSGGPVVNHNCEVVSLYTNSDTRSSMGLPLENVKEAASHAPPIESQPTPTLPEQEIVELPSLQVWSTRGCAPCGRFKNHFAPGSDAFNALSKICDVTYMPYEGNQAIAQQLGIDRFPTFYFPHTGEKLVGYSYRNPFDFIRIVTPKLAVTDSTSAPTPDEPPSSSPENEVEETGIIAKLRKKLGDFFGGIIGAAAAFLALQYHKWTTYKAEQSLFKRIALNKAEAKARTRAEGFISEQPLLDKVVTKGRSYLER